MDITTFPVAILSFDRPHYLEQTLSSLQRALTNYPGITVALFQDGAVNRFSGLQKAAVENIEICESIFRKYFPNGKLFRAADNLGIALNFDRAEKWAFQDLQAEAAFFLEDDMILGERYFEIMGTLLEFALGSSKIGMVSAYGERVNLDLDSQAKQVDQLGLMHHNWAFAITKQHWLRRNEIFSEYIGLVSACDYSHRPSEKIQHWYAKMGWPPLPTNQDLAKNAVTNFLGCVRLTTKTINAQYIGETGQHYTPEEYNRLGFGKSEIFPHHSAPALLPPAGDFIDRGIRIQREQIYSRALVGHTHRALAQSREYIRNIAFDNTLNRSVWISSAVDAAIAFGPSKGIYPDLWTEQQANLFFRVQKKLASINLELMLAPYFEPADTVVRGSIGPQQFECEIKSGRRMHASIQVEWAPLDVPLELRITLPFSKDPYSAGIGRDRRSIAAHLEILNFHFKDNTTANFSTAQLKDNLITRQPDSTPKSAPAIFNPLPSEEPPASSTPIAMTRDEVTLLCRCLSTAKRYLEYGSGGSTVRALEYPSLQVTSVDSDLDFMTNLSLKPSMARALITGKLIFRWVNIGLTGPWGNPVDASNKHLWPNYSNAPWQDPHADYDLIFIDGRFRVACFLTSILRSSGDTKILFHDYRDRDYYHLVEEFADISDSVDSLYCFSVKNQFDRNRCETLLKAYQYDPR